ncbi:MAG: hypothetical protein JNN01_20085 [Opitutaceae bacterium]|nr:hypothetical protein [Opitutaceae bacterium]
MKTSLVLAWVLSLAATTFAAETNSGAPATPKPRPRLALNAEGAVTRVDTEAPRPDVSGVVTLAPVTVATSQIAQPLRPDEPLPRSDRYVRPREFSVLYGGPLIVRKRESTTFELGVMAHVDFATKVPDGTWDFLRVSW